jgi:hypothetical protein
MGSEESQPARSTRGSGRASGPPFLSDPGVLGVLAALSLSRARVALGQRESLFTQRAWYSASGLFIVAIQRHCLRVTGLAAFAGCVSVACGGSSEIATPVPNDASPLDVATSNEDAGDEGGLAADRFVTGVVSFTPGPCAGFGASRMPGVVEGPPEGGGALQGSLDVVSLGVGGEIVLSFAPNAIVDGPGVDFIVFENPFDIGGDPQKPTAEPGEVSVSDDGVTWATFPCTATSYPYGSCAGWHVVYSAKGNGISPVDPATAGGDPFDLADLGVTQARFVRIRDRSNEVCPDAGATMSAGFDLDAVSIVNALIP